jgi:hypothetical protein
MTRKVWVPTGNLAWKWVPAGWVDAVWSRRTSDGLQEDAAYQLFQEVVEIEVNDSVDAAYTGSSVTYTGAVEWRPIPILPANPPPPTRENFVQWSTVVSNTESAAK